MTAPLDAVLAEVDRQLPQALERLFALMRIPSVSTEAAHVADCRRGAAFMKAELEGIGFSAELVESAVGGHPFVVGRHEGPAGAPHVLFYGHYDVQPIDPLNLWTAPPFEPAVETRADGSKLIRGRGSSDDKAQLKTFVEACRAWKTATGALPCRVTVFLEGEEESGSKSMPAFLRDHGKAITADVALICDTNMWNGATPAITTSLRGMAAGDLIIHGPSRDLHSGLYGGAAANPLFVLSTILASLKDETGRVTLDGFYDGAPETPAAAKAMWGGLGFSTDDFLGGVGLKADAGERGRSTLELLWARPTAEVNGIIGGYTGDGFKTVIPAEAMAKISFRLVGTQDPAKVWAAFEAHVRARLPPDCTATFVKRQGNPAVSLPLDSPAVTACAGALADEWGVETPLIGGGGSIPIAGDFVRELGMAPVLVGFALEDDNIHSPNEKYELTSFHRGARSWARILAKLAERMGAKTPAATEAA